MYVMYVFLENVVSFWIMSTTPTYLGVGLQDLDTSSKFAKWIQHLPSHKMEYLKLIDEDHHGNQSQTTMDIVETTEQSLCQHLAEYIYRNQMVGTQFIGDFDENDFYELIRCSSGHSGNLDISQWEWIWKCIQYAQRKEIKNVQRIIPWIGTSWTEYMRMQDSEDNTEPLIICKEPDEHQDIQPLDSNKEHEVIEDPDIRAVESDKEEMKCTDIEIDIENTEIIYSESQNNEIHGQTELSNGSNEYNVISDGNVQNTGTAMNAVDTVSDENGDQATYLLDTVDVMDDHDVPLSMSGQREFEKDESECFMFAILRRCIC